MRFNSIAQIFDVNNFCGICVIKNREWEKGENITLFCSILNCCRHDKEGGNDVQAADSGMCLLLRRSTKCINVEGEYAKKSNVNVKYFIKSVPTFPV